MTDPKRGEKCDVKGSLHYDGHWWRHADFCTPEGFQPEPSEPKRLYVIEHEKGCSENNLGGRSGMELCHDELHANTRRSWCKDLSCRIAVYRREEKP